MLFLMAGGSRLFVAQQVHSFVAPDREPSFSAGAYACDIEVLGTKFNMRAEESENLFSAALMRGNIKVSNRLSSGTGELIYINPDGCVDLVDGHLTLCRIEDPAECLWPGGSSTCAALRSKS